MAGAAGIEKIAQTFGTQPIAPAPSPVVGMNQEELAQLQGFTGFEPLTPLISPLLGGLSFGNPLLQTLGLTGGFAPSGLLSQVPIIPQEDIFGTAAVSPAFGATQNRFFGLLG